MKHWLDLKQPLGHVSFVALRFDVVVVLEVQPELGTGVEVAAQPQSGIGGDAAAAIENVSDPQAP